MKAAQITAYGDPSVIAINDIPEPQAGEGRVLVEVHAASLNPWDSMVRQGMAQSYMPLELPVTAGGDMAGVVKAVGAGVSHVQVGDKVYGGAGVPGGSGAFAEFAVAKADQIAHAPQNAEYAESAAMVLTGAAAIQALVDHIDLQAGQKILIQGGSGGIGSMAVQIAKHLGAYVATTVPTEALEFAKMLGADEVIDYKSQKFEEIVEDYDAVFDTAGGDVFERSFAVLKTGGVAVTMRGNPAEKTEREGIKVVNQSTHSTTRLLDKLRDLVEAGVVKVHIDKTFTLDQVQEAFRTREAGGIKGKVVLTIAD